MGNKYPKIKLDLQPLEQQKLQKLKRLKNFTSLPETFHYLLHSKTVLGNCGNILDALKKYSAERQEDFFSFTLNELSEQQRLILLSFQMGLHEKSKTRNGRRKTYDIFPSDRILVEKIKKNIKLHLGKSFSDNDIFKTLLSQLCIADELSKEESLQFLEMFKQKLNDLGSSFLTYKDMFFIDDVIEKNSEDLGEGFKKTMGYTEQLSVIDLYIDMAVEQIDYALELISKK